MLDHFLIEHCAPTLAGVKTANLFTCPFSNQTAFQVLLEERSRTPNLRGVSLEVLQFKGRRALVYVYRPRALMHDLTNSEAVSILAGFGYPTSAPENCVAHLQKRFLDQKGFPHEIGLFLGYPPEDVRGFIENSGQNYMCSGCWKVYGDVCTAQRCFERFNRCREQYKNLFAAGKTIAQLTVAV